MGLANPRPAIRARESRIVEARIKFCIERTRELIAGGMVHTTASNEAFQEAKRLKFTRAGTLAKKQ